MSESSLVGRMFVTRTHILLAFLSLTVFGFLNLMAAPDKSLGYLELIGGGAFLLDLLFLQFSHQIRLAQHVFLGLVLAFLQLMLITGGTAGTGSFWFFVFPVSGFFLMGKRWGTIWLIGLLGITATTWLLGAIGWFELAYTNVVIRQLLVSLAVVSVGIYAYQQSREQLQDETVATRRRLDDEKVRADDIVEHIGEGIVTTDTHGRVTFINRAAEKILAYRSADLLGKDFVKQVPMLDPSGNKIDADSRPLQQALRNGQATTTVANYLRGDGQIVPVSVTGMAVVSDGQTVGAIGTFRDLSEEHSVVRAKSEFLTLASHQLRTPISAISWLSELLLNGDAGKLTAQQHEHLKAIYDSNQRMANLVGDMLMVSSLDLGSLPTVPEPTDLPKLADHIIKDLGTSRTKQARITASYSPKLPRIPLDPDIMKLILRHLLSNAIKYTPASGHIKLTIEPSTEERLHSGSQGSVIITVTDNGYGIPEGVTDKVFAKFFRGSNILHKDTDGTGLGLYIVKNLLDYVGGHISFTSQENKGTSFKVVLALEGMAEHRLTGSQSSADIGLAAKKGVNA